MVKPLQARRLPRQSTVSLHEEDLNSSDADQTRELPGLVGDTTNNEYDGQFGARARDTTVHQSSSTSAPSNELSDSPLGPTYRSGGVGGGDGSGALDSTSASDDSLETVRHRPCSSRKSQISSTHDAHISPRDDSSTGQLCDTGQCSSITPPEHNHFSSSYDCPEGVTSQTAALGRDLYLRFLHEEIRVCHIREPACLNPWEEASLDRRYLESLNTSAQARHSLRQVADVFATSEHRDYVRQKAASINIESLDYNSFQDLLFGLFQEGGVTSERVVVLFFFCADLTIRALQDQLTNSFHSLLDWSQLYFSSTFAQWVESHGGWAAVLDQSANHLYLVAKIGLVCAGIVALCVYIRNAR